jgi:ribonuclease HI
MATVIEVFTDGSINTFLDLPEGKQNISGIGILIPKNAYIDRVVIKKAFFNFTINATELLAILYALYKLNESLTQSEKETSIILINSDSKLSVDGLTTYYKTWMKFTDSFGVWLKSNNLPVENQDIYKEILQLKNNFFKVEFKHVRAHADNALNNEVDLIAKEAVNDYYINVKKRLGDLANANDPSKNK